MKRPIQRTKEFSVPIQSVLSIGQHVTAMNLVRNLLKRFRLKEMLNDQSSINTRNRKANA